MSYSKFSEYVKIINFLNFDVLKVRLKIFKNNKNYNLIFRTTSFRVWHLAGPVKRNNPQETKQDARNRF